MRCCDADASGFLFSNDAEHLKGCSGWSARFKPDGYRVQILYMNYFFLNFFIFILQIK